MKKAKNLLKEELEEKLANLSANLNESNKNQYKELQEQLNDIVEQEIQGVVLRSLCEDYEKGEKCSKYFFSLEKYRAKQKTINRIKLSCGSLTSDSKTILQECRSFYQNLYRQNENTNINIHPEFFTSVPIPKLSDKETH